MSGMNRIRSGISGALIALTLSTPLMAASDGAQLLSEKRAEAAISEDPQAQEEWDRDTRLGSSIAAGTAVGIALGIGLILLALQPAR